MKKVLLVTHVGDFIPQFEMDNVRCLQQMGYEVHYAANFSQLSYGDKKKRLEGSGVICHMIPFQRSPFRMDNIRAYRALSDLLASETFEMLHCHTPIGGAMARLAARGYRKKGMKVLYTAHGFHFFKGAPAVNWLVYYPVERFLSRFTDVQITINQEDYERARHFHAGRVIQIPGVGIDTKKLGTRILKNREEFRSELGIEEDEFCLLSVGELDENKNHVTVLTALQRMNAEEREGLCYLIGGKGELKEKLQKEIEEKGLSGCARLLGYRNDIPKVYEAADCFVFPSHREGLSAALMEAMAKGLPVTASKIRGNVDLIDEGQGGFLVDSKNPEAFKRAILRLKRDPQLCHEMSRHNKSVAERYDKRKVRDVMDCLYQEVLS